MSPLNTEERARKKTEEGEAQGVRGLPALTGFEVGGRRPRIRACGSILQSTANKKTGNSAVVPRETEFQNPHGQETEPSPEPLERKELASTLRL